MTATSTPTWRLTGSERCSYSELRSPIRVRLSSRARAGVHEILGATTDKDDRESGGLLLGAVSEGLIEVLTVSSSGPLAIREPDRFRPDFEHDLRLADELRDAHVDPVDHPVSKAPFRRQPARGW